MQQRSRTPLAAVRRIAADRPALALRVRLFGLLLLLIPLFAGLQQLVSDAAPRPDGQSISEERPTPVPVERTVERIIYVPVPADETPAPSAAVPSTPAVPATGPTPAP